VKRAVQYFQADYLENCKEMNPEQILRFLEDFRLLHSSHSSKKRLISLRISECLLDAAKTKARALGVPYQTQIHRLIENWVKS
jgi:predicted DNA binding CopG/RHH family protein